MTVGSPNGREPVERAHLRETTIDVGILLPHSYLRFELRPLARVSLSGEVIPPGL